MSERKYKTLEQLYKDYPWRTKKKFMPIASKYGFSKQEAEEFITQEVAHDKKYTPEKYFLPIFSQRPDAYQFDTLEQTPQASPRYFLIIINVNSRKLYAYPMNNKGAAAVLEALNKFKNSVKKITSMTSDSDSAYLTSQVLSFMKSNHIDYRTTQQNDHNKLGIINRVIRTLRDMNHDRDFTAESMIKCVKAYNSSEHSSIEAKPNSFSKDDEMKYIHRMINLTDSRRATIPIGTHVRTVIPKELIPRGQNVKRRSTFSQQSYVVDAYTGNQYIIRAKDDSTAVYPRHQLVEASKAIKLASTINNGKQGLIDRIYGHEINSRKVPYYKVIYEGGVKDKIPMSYIRGTRPTMMTLKEKEYWGDRTIPEPYA